MRRMRDLDTLWARVQSKDTRPLLKGNNPKLIMKSLLENRNSTYEEADLVVHSKRNITQLAMVSKLVKLLLEYKVLEFRHAS